MIKNLEKKESKRIYFDWAASAPWTNIDIPLPYGNPSSLHYEGKTAKKAIEDARQQCADILNVPPDTLYFTSGGTESNSIALFSNFMKIGQGRVLASMAEHASIRDGMETLEKMGRPVGKIAVDSSGIVTAETLEKALDKYPDTRFVSIMSVNNETGAITDIPLISNILKNKIKAPVHLHCDLVQAIGKIPVDIQNWEIDSASISAHKINGPRGIGLLYLRKPLEVFYSGGGQENGIRGGTENTYGAVALAKSLEKGIGKREKGKEGKGKREQRVDNNEHITDTFQKYFIQAQERFDKLIKGLSMMERCVFIPSERSEIEALLSSPFSLFPSPFSLPKFSPYILQVAFKGIPGEVMARALDDLGFAVSTGSACSSSSPERPVLMAMGVSENLRLEGIRISQGYTTTDEDIDLLLDAIAEVLKFL